MTDSAAQTTISLQALKAELQALSQQADVPVDPLRYYYLHALLNNLESRTGFSEARFQSLFRKAEGVLTDYTNSRQQAASVDTPEAKEAVGLSALKALNVELQNRFAKPLANNESSTLSPRSQKDLVSSGGSKAELQAVKHYQQLFEKMSVERLLNKVMQEIPENAGPLNPERMVIRCLSALQDISPVYAMRLIGYYEALICLQSLPLSDK